MSEAADPLAGGGHPVDVRLEVEVPAAPDRVWELLTRVESWPGWHPGIQVSVLRGRLEAGTRLDWRADGMRIRSVVREVDAPRRLGLTLRMIGGRGYARWTISPTGGGYTLVRIEEVWDGLLVRILRRTLGRTIRVSRAAWLEALRGRLESGDEAADQ